jgi:hypothetical protein
MVHFCRLVNIAAMAIRCMPVDAKHFPIVQSGSTCGGTLSEKRKDRKNLFFYGNHFEEIRIWIRFSANPDSEQLLTKTKKELRQSPIDAADKVRQPMSTLPGTGVDKRSSMEWT